MLMSIRSKTRKDGCEGGGSQEAWRLGRSRILGLPGFWWESLDLFSCLGLLSLLWLLPDDWEI
ncbi:hypothetical protein AKJ62_05000 [candidate division MSBL1 archaeon SCGC-AAA259D14]|uniref:Uncharacterized protein n=1 Tax=candidate division MSBL1 archaeon SCGC-AAA259D14 TaxID=1698261 RepID=A0A133U2V7_9EURY|nr:hypothetical protein AKJ62_05000 [candidate division MSBL1 archaeon SCGC-AAA259D14]